MEIGIFSRTFERPNLAATLDAIQAAGLYEIQFNLEAAGIANMPEVITPELASTIQHEITARGLRMAAVSGTFNIIHPDPAQREAGMRSLRAIAAACKAMGTSIITLSTGTRNAENMWRAHPANNSAEAWQDMLVSMHAIAAIGAEYDVIMAFEPEVSNVVDSAQKARQLLDILQSPHVKVVIDGANLFHTGELPAMQQILEEAFALLGADIVLAHAKDINQDGEAGHEAAGQGLLDYALYIGLLREYGYTGPLVLHSLTEEQVPGCVQFLREKMS